MVGDGVEGGWIGSQMEGRIGIASLIDGWMDGLGSWYEKVEGEVVHPPALVL